MQHEIMNKIFPVDHSFISDETEFLLTANNVVKRNLFAKKHDKVMKDWVGLYVTRNGGINHKADSEIIVCRQKFLHYPNTHYQGQLSGQIAERKEGEAR